MSLASINSVSLDKIAEAADLVLRQTSGSALPYDTSIPDYQSTLNSGIRAFLDHDGNGNVTLTLPAISLSVFNTISPTVFPANIGSASDVLNSFSGLFDDIEDALAMGTSNSLLIAGWSYGGVLANEFARTWQDDLVATQMQIVAFGSETFTVADNLVNIGFENDFLFGAHTTFQALHDANDSGNFSHLALTQSVDDTNIASFAMDHWIHDFVEAPSKAQGPAIFSNLILGSEFYRDTTENLYFEDRYAHNDFVLHTLVDRLDTTRFIDNLDIQSTIVLVDTGYAPAAGQPVRLSTRAETEHATDTIYWLGSDSADDIRGRVGKDMIEGGIGADALRGNKGGDKLYGGKGADTLNGQRGNDLLRGGNGNDVLNGGKGGDTLRGDGGDDVFVFQASGGKDTIVDFKLGDDLIDLTSLNTNFGSLTVQANSGDAKIVLSGTTIILNGITNTDLDAGDFIF